MDNFSEEAEWTFGLAWLSIIYEKLGKKKKAKQFLEKTIGTQTKDGEIPELYYSNTNKPNDNTPLGWSESLFITALHEVNNKHMRLKKEVLKSATKKTKKPKKNTKKR